MNTVRIAVKGVQCYKATLPMINHTPVFKGGMVRYGPSSIESRS